MSEYYYEECSDRIYHKKYLINRSTCTTLLDGYEVCKKLNDLERQLEEAKNKLNEIESVCNGYKAMQSEYATSTEIPYWDIMNIIEGYNKGERR